VTDDPELVAAAIDPLVAAEHPGLRVWTARIDARVGRTPRELRERLRLAADRFRGAQAIALRTRPVPHAYRVLFRHLGLDPDVTRPPLEELVVDRLLHGGFASHGLPADALALATLETGVPVWAVDADRTGPLALAPGDDGRLALFDDDGPVAPLFGPPLADRAPTGATRAMLLIVVQAPGVEDIFVEESLWTAASAMHTIDASS
jgi:hypothetical protein